jgi:Flp pilus assembly pilin Flp
MQTAEQMAAAFATFLADDSGMSLMEFTLITLLIAVICILGFLALSGTP